MKSEIKGKLLES